MKHGLYMSILEADELENLEMFESRTLIHELVLMRVMLRRLTLYLNNDDLPLADMLAIMPLVSTMVRTVVRLLNNMEEKGFDWDEVLDELGKDLGIDI